MEKCIIPAHYLEPYSKEANSTIHSQETFLITVPSIPLETCPWHITYATVILSVSWTMSQWVWPEAIELLTVDFLRVLHLSLTLISSFLPFLPHPLDPSAFFSIIPFLSYSFLFLPHFLHKYLSRWQTTIFHISKLPSRSAQPASLTFPFPSSFPGPFQFLHIEDRGLCSNWG